MIFQSLQKFITIQIDIKRDHSHSDVRYEKVSTEEEVNRSFIKYNYTEVMEFKN